jgi:hypothetical protein
LGRGSIAGGSVRDEAQRIERGGLVGRKGQSDSGAGAPRVNLGRGSIAGGSGLDWAERIERHGLVGRERQSRSACLGGKCAPRIDLGRGSLKGGGDVDAAQRIARRGLVGRDGQSHGARRNRREPRELFLGVASDARHLERDLPRHSPGYGAYRPRAYRPAKHRTHLFRTEAAKFSFASRELDPPPLVSSNAGRASP